MTSPYERPDIAALDRLEHTLDHLGDELAAWRRRCLTAESELASVKGAAGMVPGDELVRLRARSLDLERENLDLNARIERARSMLVTLQQRLEFVERSEPSEGVA